MPHLNSHDGNCLGPSVLGVVPKLFFHHKYILLHILPTRDSCCSLNTFASFFPRLFFSAAFFLVFLFEGEGRLLHTAFLVICQDQPASPILFCEASWRILWVNSMQCPGVFSRGPGSQCWKLQGSDVGLSACRNIIAAVDAWSVRCTPPKPSGEGLAAPSREPRGLEMVASRVGWSVTSRKTLATKEDQYQRIGFAGKNLNRKTWFLPCFYHQI